MRGTDACSTPMAAYFIACSTGSTISRTFMIMTMYQLCTFFFFFQAEDGIRDLTVTGVQTCALPIYRLAAQGLVRRGVFLADRPGPQYVHIAVLEEIQRRQVHARRVPRPVATPERF